MLNTTNAERLLSARRLTDGDGDAVAQHFRSLDWGRRYARFGRIMTDADVSAYARGLASRGGIGIGLFGAVGLIGFGEILPLSRPWNRHAEIVFTILADKTGCAHQAWRPGFALLTQMISEARRLGFSHLQMSDVGADPAVMTMLDQFAVTAHDGMAGVDVQWINLHHGLEQVVVGCSEITAVIALRAKAPRPAAHKKLTAVAAA
jgi:hypothetical protein